MDIDLKPKIYKGLMAATALGAATLVNNTLDYSWRKITKEDPPRDPLAPHISWKKAIIWAALTGIVVSIVKLLVTRVTHVQWARRLGEDPNKYK